jgi:hypothetical protein
MHRNFPPGPPSEHALKRQKFRKFHWFRHFNRDSEHPKWGAVATRAGVEVAEVIATVNKLQEVANEGQPRGSLDDFVEQDWAYVLKIDPQVIGRIYAALEECGWIEQGRIPLFEQRNPDQEDLSTPRVRAHRERLKTEKEARERAAFLALTGRDAKRVSTVTETTRAEQIKRDSGGAVDNSGDVARGDEARQPGDEANAAQAGRWIAERGKQLLVDRLSIGPALAETYLERWRRDVDDIALAAIIKAADDVGYIGARFHTIITDQVRRHVAQRQMDGQAALPLAPVAIRRSAS